MHNVTYMRGVCGFFMQCKRERERYAREFMWGVDMYVHVCEMQTGRGSRFVRLMCVGGFLFYFFGWEGGNIIDWWGGGVSVLGFLRRGGDRSVI